MYVAQEADVPFEGGSPTPGFFSKENGRPVTSLDLLVYLLQRENPFKADAKSVNSSESEKTEGHQKESNSKKKRLRRVLHDHPYAYNIFRSDGFNNEKDQPISVEEEENDDVRLKEENKWKPMKEVKVQFLIGTDPLMNPHVSSFDVACIEEFNPDGSPVDKMHVVSSCVVHGHCEECISKPLGSNRKRKIWQDVHLKCINNEVNRRPQCNARKRKATSSLDVSENEENVDKLIIMKLIDDLSKKKRNKEPLICEICGKQFTAVATLKNHYRSHGNIKLYACSLCPASFTRRFGLRYHMQIHYNKFRYTCSECSRKFRHTSHFKAHCRDHSFGRPLQCTQCPSSFKNINTLNRHMNKKHASTEEQE